jgi:hypothetical protein
MKEQLITFETAKLAKENGFKEQVYSFYGETEEIEPYWNTNSDETKITSNRISAPTQSLLQKWLRDVHDIEVEVFAWRMTLEEALGNTFLFKEGKYYAGVIDVRGKDDEEGSDYVETYEEALEKGLATALKLITL